MCRVCGVSEILNALADFVQSSDKLFSGVNVKDWDCGLSEKSSWNAVYRAKHKLFFTSPRQLNFAWLTSRWSANSLESSRGWLFVLRSLSLLLRISSRSLSRSLRSTLTSLSILVALTFTILSENIYNVTQSLFPLHYKSFSSRDRRVQLFTSSLSVGCRWHRRCLVWRSIETRSCHFNKSWEMFQACKCCSSLRVPLDSLLFIQ